MNYLYAAFLGYFLGCINISYIYGRLRGLDIRKTGTTNAGASNALLTFGPVFGITAALCDIGKTVLASCLADAAFRDEYSGSIAAAACILGHIYPVSMGFRGGKGIASFGGYVLSSDWRVF